MANLKDIRAQIESTKNTQQITKAMKLVSASKLRKAQHNITNMRPYALALRRVISDIAITQKITHPLMEQKKTPQSVLMVVLTSDRGLCGAFNTNINKFAERFIKNNTSKYKQLDFIFIGRKGFEYFSKRAIQSIDYITKLDKDISYDLASHVADKLLKNFLSGHYDEIKLVYNEFKSAISQNVVCETLLPISEEHSSFNEVENSGFFSKDLVFEPEPEKVISQLLVKHFDLQVYRAMSESVAAEHGARMTAMENASNNAKDLIGKLTLTYNKLRQEKITTELIEIVSGAEALK